MKILLSLLLISSTTLAQNYNYQRNCIDEYSDAMYEVQGKIGDIYVGLEPMIFALGSMSLTFAILNTPGMNGAWYKTRKAKNTALIASGGVMAGSVGYAVSKAFKKKHLKKRVKDIMKTIEFMTQAELGSGELFDKVYDDFRNDYPYLYPEELAQITFESFSAPQPNMLCPVGEILKFKQFIKRLKREVGFAQNRGEKR